MTQPNQLSGYTEQIKRLELEKVTLKKRDEEKYQLTQLILKPEPLSFSGSFERILINGKGLKQ